MKQTLTLLLVLTIAVISTSVAAVADIKGYYLGGMVGYTQFDSSNFDGNSIDDSAINYGVYGGYYTSKNFALETTYVITSNIIDHPDTDNNYISLAAKFHHYFNHTYSMFIKVGAASMNLDTTDDYDGIGWLWSVGFNLAFRNNVNVRLAYERVETELDTSGSDDTINSDLDNIYLGVHYQF